MPKMEIFSIQEEFRKNPRLKQEDIDHLRKWINEEKYVPASISDLQITLFLHCCHYRVNETKDLMKLNYKWRSDHPDYFTKRNPKLSPQLQRSLSTVTVIVLPQRSSANELILFAKVIDNNPNEFYFSETIKLFFMFMDAYLVHHGTNEGVVFLYDCEPLTFSLARRITIGPLKLLSAFLQEAIQFNVNAIHLLNSHAAFNFIFTIVKPFLYGGLMSKIHFHKKGSNTIFSHLSPTCIPKHYGGEDESSLEQLHEQSHELLQSLEPWFKEEENALTDFTFMQCQKRS